jgi:cobalt transporter subunit CbtB
MNTSSTTLSSPVIAARIVPAVSALLLGLFLFIGAGFAGPTILHSSTHDTRHAFGLRCH